MSDTRTLLVHDNRGRFKVTIPADWKVTFSAFNPGKGFDGGTPALRIYEAENKQRACFTNVHSFRDLSLKIEREFVAESGESRWERDKDGSTESRKTKVERSWEDE